MQTRLDTKRALIRAFNKSKSKAILGAEADWVIALKDILKKPAVKALGKDDVLPLEILREIHTLLTESLPAIRSRSKRFAKVLAFFEGITKAISDAEADAKKATESPLPDLPDETIAHIFSFLNLKELLAMRLVSSRWKDIVESFHQSIVFPNNYTRVKRVIDILPSRAGTELLENKYPIKDIALSHDGKTLAILEADYATPESPQVYLKLVNIADFSLVSIDKLRYSGWCRGLTFTNDDRYLVYAEMTKLYVLNLKNTIVSYDDMLFGGPYLNGEQYILPYAQNHLIIAGGAIGQGRALVILDIESQKIIPIVMPNSLAHAEFHNLLLRKNGDLIAYHFQARYPRHLFHWVRINLPNAFAKNNFEATVTTSRSKKYFFYNNLSARLIDDQWIHFPHFASRDHMPIPASFLITDKKIVKWAKPIFTLNNVHPFCEITSNEFDNVYIARGGKYVVVTTRCTSVKHPNTKIINSFVINNSRHEDISGLWKTLHDPNTGRIIVNTKDKIRIIEVQKHFLFSTPNHANTAPATSDNEMATHVVRRSPSTGNL